MAVLNTSSVSPDGKVIAAGRNIGNVVFIYDASAARFKKALLGDVNKSNNVSAQSLSISNDSQFLAAAGIDEMVVVWDLSNDKIRNRFESLRGALALSFSPTKNVLAASAPENSVTLLKIPEGDQVGRLNGHTAPVIAMAFSPDGKMLATGGTDKTVRVWSVDDLSQLRVFDGYEYPVHSVSFSPDGNSLATYSGGLKVWRWGEGNTQTVAMPEAEHSSVQAVAALALFLSSARTIHLVGAPVGSPLYSAPSDVAQAISRRLPVIFSPDGKNLGSAEI